MKRYSLHKVIIPLSDRPYLMAGFEHKMIEEDQGEWVKYEEVKDIIEILWHAKKLQPLSEKAQE